MNRTILNNLLLEVENNRRKEQERDKLPVQWKEESMYFRISMNREVPK